MKIYATCFLLLFLLLTETITSQNTDNLKAINADLWQNFTKAFEELDYNLFASLHCDNMIRVSGDAKTIKNKAEYIDGYKNHWKDKKIHQTISFRFLERICDANKASERGIYKLTIKPNTENEKSYYGKFHVILKKENEIWKILMDYDSSEKNRINEESYLEAFDIEDFKDFKK